MRLGLQVAGTGKHLRRTDLESFSAAILEAFNSCGRRHEAIALSDLSTLGGLTQF
jgi:hypothetical protein